MTEEVTLDGVGRQAPERFEPFELAIERAAADSYRVRVTASPVGARPPVDVDLSGLEIHPPEAGKAGSRGQGNKGSTPRDIRRRQVDMGSLRSKGEQLFRAVFVAGVAEAFRASLERVRGRNSELLIKVRCDETPEVAALPWEALFDPAERVFMPVARGLAVNTETVSVPPAPPLRILAMLPEPRGEPELSGAAEWAKIRGHLGDLLDTQQVVAERVEPPSLEQLDRQLQGTCDVLHIVAHGAPGRGGLAGSLQLEDSCGRPDRVSGLSLARALEGRRPPQLVFLSACHGGGGAEDDAFDGLAQHLLSRGVPAVIAMRSAISDGAAVTFACSLYRELAAGRSVEASVVKARRQLALGEHRSEWATPVLYLRDSNVRIFEAAPRGLVATPDPRPRRRLPGLLAAAVALVAAAAFFALREPNQLQEDPSLVDTSLSSLEVPPQDPACPSPEGLQDLRFVKIEPGVLSLEGRTLVVEEAFCISTKEVSRRDWNEVMGESRGNDSDAERLPANNLTLLEAREFNHKLNLQDSDANYRLPEAVEWEYAARAGKKTLYFFGDSEQDLHLYGNCENPHHPDNHDVLAQIGSYQPNEWGLYDVHGNVAEWVEWPMDAKDPRSTGVEVVEGVRRKFDSKNGWPVALKLGGSYENVPRNCVSDESSEVKLDARRSEVGFRVVRDLLPTPGTQGPT